MNTAIYAVTRMVSLLIGWGIAYGLSLAADWLIAGAKWFVFIALAAWWTYVSFVYVSREAQRNRQL